MTYHTKKYEQKSIFMHDTDTTDKMQKLMAKHNLSKSALLRKLIQEAK